MVEDRAGDRGAPGGSLGPAGGRQARPEDRIFAAIDQAIADARDLERWWRATDAAGAYRERFDLATTGGPDTGFGFFDQAEVAGSDLPVMGHVLDRLYDRPKAIDASPGAPAAGRAAWISAQVREFVLRYFLRVSDFSAPEAFAGKNGHVPPPYLRPFSWYPDEAQGGRGFGFEQLYFKRRGSDRPERFAEEERHAIVDLRQIGTTYEWVVVKADVFDFNLVLAPFGQSYPHGTLPATESNYLVLHQAFVEDEHSP